MYTILTTNRIRIFVSLIISMLLVFSMATPHWAHAATLTVDTLLDENDGSCSDGDCSLRDALKVSATEDTISFSVTGTIVLNLGQLTVDKNLTIIGPGADYLTVSGNNSSRVFYVTGGNTAFSGLTIANGSAIQDLGGGFYNVGDSTLTNITFNGNSASYGGGIYNSGSYITLTNVTLSGNSAVNNFFPGLGGGMYNYGTSTLKNVTFSGNSAQDTGGGMYAYLGTNTLTNVTFSGNSASSGGGIYNNNAIFTLTNVTISGNSANAGGGVYGGAILKNIILAGNTAASGPDCNGTLNSYGYNLIQAPSGCTIAGDETGNIYGKDPLLGPLQDNGGATLTHALLPGRPAIDTADFTDPYGSLVIDDQRGVDRPQGFDNDIGSYEVYSESGEWECYDDGSPDPCHNSLNSVSIISSTDGWAVGENGIILHWNGDTWVKTDSPTENNLVSVAFSSSNDGWIVGGWGDTIIMHWNGYEWTLEDAPSTSGLSSVAVISSTDAWAVGYYGYILHWDGNQWSETSSPTSKSLTSIIMLSSTDGWAVGSNGTIIHWDGNQWLIVSSPITETIYSISMASTTDGWAVTWGGTMLRWNGSSWVDFENNTDLISLSFITMVSPTNGWAVGQDANANGDIIHWNGSIWENKPSSVYEVLVSFSVIPGTEGNQGWAAGWGGRVAKWDGIRLTPAQDSNTVSLQSVKMISSIDGWIVGRGPNSGAPMLHWNGTSWLEDGNDWLNDIDFESSQNGWAIGREIMQWDGSNWTWITRSQNELFSLDIVLNNDVWAVGGGNYSDCDPFQPNCSEIVHWNGNKWNNVPNPSLYPLYSISMISSDDGWVVGGSWACPVGENCSTILRWNGTEWIKIESPTTESLNAVAMDSTTSGWAVGAGGTILNWDGTEWSIFSSPVATRLYAIDMLSTTDGWIVGGEGTILHWNGTSWVKVNSPVDAWLKSVSASPTHVWAVGENGVILKYAIPQASLSINYSSGKPGSYFNIVGKNFQANQTAMVSINGSSIGSIPVDTDGKFTFTLTTNNADEGYYYVTTSVNPSATAKFILDNDSETRSQEGSFPSFDVPTGISFREIYLPIMIR